MDLTAIQDLSKELSDLAAQLWDFSYSPPRVKFEPGPLQAEFPETTIYNDKRTIGHLKNDLLRVSAQHRLSPPHHLETGGSADVFVCRDFDDRPYILRIEAQMDHMLPRLPLPIILQPQEAGVVQSHIYELLHLLPVISLNPAEASPSAKLSEASAELMGKLFREILRPMHIGTLITEIAILPDGTPLIFDRGDAYMTSAQEWDFSNGIPEGFMDRDPAPAVYDHAKTLLGIKSFCEKHNLPENLRWLTPEGLYKQATLLAGHGNGIGTAMTRHANSALTLG